MPVIHETQADTLVNNLTSALDHELEALIQANLSVIFPALAVTIVQRGEALLNAAWGWIDPETEIFPARTDSLFDLASVSKMFTVTAFLSLVNAGKVEVDSPLVEIVPEFGLSGPRPTDGGQDPHSKAMLPVADDMRGKTIDPTSATLRHLAAHTSGLAPWRAVYNAAGTAPVAPDQPETTPRQLRWARGLEMICNSPFVGIPGDQIRYSDLGMMLLGEVVSRLHGTDLDTAVQACVLTPLNLPSITYNPVRNGRPQSTTVPTEMDRDWRKRRPWGEVHDENACGLAGIAGHAGLFGTARDVAAFGHAWLESDPHLGIAPHLLHEAVTEQSSTGEARHGLGWVLHTESSTSSALSQRSYGHTGFTGTSLWIDPDRALVVACLSNRVYYGREREGVEAFRRTFHQLLAQTLT